MLILIIGGGTAGWLTAGILAAEFGKNTNHQITLIESPDISTIGVGEGTWPTMRETLRRIGVSEFEFFQECDASFKQGTQFVDWRDCSKGDVYYHPFVMPKGYFETNLASFWHSKCPGTEFASAFTSQPQLCRKLKAPKQLSTPEFAAVINYGYHLDAGKFADFLKKHCTQKLNVTHIRDTVTGVISGEREYIEALTTSHHGKLTADLFIDCSGTHGLLIKQHFKIPFIDKSNVLFNDRALAIQVSYPNVNSPIESATISTAQSAGWIWDIGLPTRKGIGYVYSSNHSSENEAEATLHNYLNKIGSEKNAINSARLIHIKPGYHTKFWHKNFVAIGMSAGFIEPLEASALVMVELAAEMIRDELPVNFEVMGIVEKRFNETFLYRWERIIDFLKLHYVLSKRDDSNYWIEHKNNSQLSDRLRELLALWKFRSPSRNDLPQIQEVFPSASYQYILYGMGYNTLFPSRDSTAVEFRTAEKYFLENIQTTQLHLSNLPSNRDLLNKIRIRETH